MAFSFKNGAASLEHGLTLEMDQNVNWISRPFQFLDFQGLLTERLHRN